MNQPPTIQETLDLYRSLPELYPAEDAWHRVTHHWVQAQVRRAVQPASVSEDEPLLNLGSGGESFGLPESGIQHVDIHDRGFRPDQRLLVADIQRLPSLGKSFSTCLCVGSALNHCSAAEVIAGIANAMRPGGLLVLEFESSRSFEFLGSASWGRGVALVQTVYQNRPVKLWAYSPSHVRALLQSHTDPR